jgi:hypothetical protein
MASLCFRATWFKGESDLYLDSALVSLTPKTRPNGA